MSCKPKGLGASKPTSWSLPLADCDPANQTCLLTPSAIGYRASRNSVLPTVLPPRAANSHSTSVGRRTKPVAPSSLGNLSVAFFRNQILSRSLNCIASNQLIAVLGSISFIAGFGHVSCMTAWYCNSVISYFPIR